MKQINLNFKNLIAQRNSTGRYNHNYVHTERKNKLENFTFRSKNIRQATESASRTKITRKFSIPSSDSIQKQKIHTQKDKKEKQMLSNAIEAHMTEISKIKLQKQNLELQKESLISLMKQLEDKLQLNRNTNRRVRQYFQQGVDLSNSLSICQYLNSHSPNLAGGTINIETMTYQQLLQLQQMIGPVNRGLTSEQKSLLQKHHYFGDLTELCTICYSNVCQNQVVTELNCKHIFHHQCIVQWLGKQKSCPVCKRQVLSSSA